MNKNILYVTAMLTGITLSSSNIGVKYTSIKTNTPKIRPTILKVQEDNNSETSYIENELNLLANTDTDDLGIVYSGKNVVDCNGYPYDLFFGEMSYRFWGSVGDRYPFKGDKITNFMGAAYALSHNYYGDSWDVGPGDAFMHIYLVAMISYTYGESFANEFITFYQGSYVGSNIVDSNRETMDNHNNGVAVKFGTTFKEKYKDRLTGNLEEDMGTYCTHIVRYGEYYDVIELTDDGLGFINTYRGVRNTLFPPSC